jgi:hypothetical protein
VVKSLDEFHAVNDTLDGYRNKCKACRNEERQENRISAGPALPPERPMSLYFQILFQPEEWKSDAACAGAASDVSSYDDFFPTDDSSVTNVNRTKFTKCVVCPVAFECLEYSARIEANGGLWGGLSGDVRRRFLNKVDIKSPKAKHQHAVYMDDLRDQASRWREKVSA